MLAWEGGRKLLKASSEISLKETLIPATSDIVEMISSGVIQPVAPGKRFPNVSDGFERMAVAHFPVSLAASTKGIRVVGVKGQAMTYPSGV
jgi:hypothetical protein